MEYVVFAKTKRKPINVIVAKYEQVEYIIEIEEQITSKLDPETYIPPINIYIFMKSLYVSWN